MLRARAHTLARSFALQMSQSSLRVCVYNYKGGAAKTTIIVNTAAALAHPDHGNKKVLLIDLDPQCNSTQFYHDDSDLIGGGRTLTKEECQPTDDCQASNLLLHSLPGTGPEPKLMNDREHDVVEAPHMDALVGNQGKSPLYKMMHKLFVSRQSDQIRAMIEKDGFDLLHQVNVDNLIKDRDESGVQLTDASGNPILKSPFGGNFWLLEGDPCISMFEAQFAHSFANVGDQAEIMSFGFLSHIMNIFTEVLEFDVIMIDCSPSNSALNKAAALACDYILPPCMASLYSAGSIAGLLTSVLPGENGWLGLHAKITKEWHDEQFNVKPEVMELRNWLLPATPPQLLPIMVSNYAMGEPGEDMKAEPKIIGARKKSRKMTAHPPPVSRWASADDESKDTRVIKLMSSQFIYTIKNFVYRHCRHVAGHKDGPPDGFKGPLVRFRDNHGHRVINFAETAPIAMPIAEQLGRSFVEVNLFDYLSYIMGEQAATELLSNAEKVSAEASGKKRKVKNAGMISYGPDCDIFLGEVEMMKQRFSALSAWLVHLLNEKRCEGNAAGPSGAGPSWDPLSPPEACAASASAVALGAPAPIGGADGGTGAGGFEKTGDLSNKSDAFKAEVRKRLHAWEVNSRTASHIPGVYMDPSGRAKDDQRDKIIDALEREWKARGAHPASA